MHSPSGYDLMSRINHWLIAIAILGMLALGLFLEFGGLAREDKRWLIDIHKSVGVLVLIYGVWRVLWRIIQGFPESDESTMPQWQEIASKIAHWALLAGILIMPISGVVASIFNGRSIAVFNWFSIPAQTEIAWLSGAAGYTHKYTGFTLALIVALHIAAALKHHFVDRDSVLIRMVQGAAK
ncbi:cytochrome b [Pararhizobium sp. IMCC21322]|uniref:cytochrome b n=1 Tax=Pararhizobium sp. IMCC21322 TaxID=3067903 RepID=UPI00274043AB|nr:cytochrome b [Pararhizobium sp. IMCC21322]